MQTHAGTAVPQQHEAEPTYFGLNPGGWVALAMIVVFAILTSLYISEAVNLH
jgi:hypothetical protein